MTSRPLPAPFAPEPLPSEVASTSGGGEAFHELRVRIPTETHRQLLALKILRGVTLAETVVIALDRYFEDHEPAEPSAKLP